MRLTITLVAATALAACSSKPDPNTFGGRLALEGGEVAAIGQDWNEAQEERAEGEDLVETGQARIRKAEKQIVRGEDEIRDGERMIAAAERKAADAEARYAARQQVPSLGGATGQPPLRKP